MLTDLFQVFAAHAGRGVTGDRTEGGPAGGGGQHETGADRGSRKQRDHETGRQPGAPAEHPTDTSRRLVLLDDLHFAVVPVFDDGRVVRVDQTRLGVEQLHGVVVVDRVIDVRVDADEGEEGVSRHGGSSGCGW